MAARRHLTAIGDVDVGGVRLETDNHVLKVWLEETLDWT